MDKIDYKENIDRFLKSRHIKVQHEWGWQVVADLFLAGTGAGSLVFAMLMDWMGYVNTEIRPFLLWGFVMVAAGAMFLVLKLGVKIRFLNTVINPMSSWLSRGFYILSGCIISGGLLFVAAVLQHPFIFDWLGWDISAFNWIIRILEIVCFIFGMGSAIYTGILILSVKYVPVWYTPLLPVLFTISALASGSMTVILSALVFGVIFDQLNAFTDMIHLLVYVQLVIVALEAAALWVFMESRKKIGEMGEYSIRLITHGKLKNIYRIGLLAIGFGLSLVLEIAWLIVPDAWILLLASGMFMLIGRFCLRWITVYSGLKELPPMLRMVETKLRKEKEPPPASWPVPQPGQVE